MNERRRILVTGANGFIGRILVPHLGEEYEIVRHERPGAVPDAEGFHPAELTDPGAIRTLMDGVDTVVHLAATAAPDSTWEQVLESNLIGVRHVLEAARTQGVRRVVFASSNHAMGMYDRDGQWPVTSHQLPRGDSLYGVSKIFGEALGRYYHDEYGMDFIALRIGWVSAHPEDANTDLLRGMWLSPGDTVRVFRAAIEVRDVGFGLFYAVSDNPNRRWDMTDTMLELGYRPQDSWFRAVGRVEHVTEGGASAPGDWPARA